MFLFSVLSSLYLGLLRPSLPMDGSSDWITLHGTRIRLAAPFGAPLLCLWPSRQSFRATPLLRVKAKITVKNSVCCRRRLSHTACLTVILALTLKSGVALTARRSFTHPGIAGGTPRSWGEWSTPSACSETCGTGTTSRTRDCDGDCGTCAGDATDSQTCTGGPWLLCQGSLG